MKTNIKEYWPIILMLLAIIGFVSKALYNYPLAIMAIIGFYRFILHGRSIWEDQILKTFIILFLCLWIPLLVSFFDAVNQSRSSQTILPYLRFLFAGIFIIQELSKDSKRFQIFINCVCVIVIFWCIDASIQFFVGFNLLGFPYKVGDITGMFYPRNTISHICAILSPICFLVIFKNKNKWFWLSIIPLFFVVLISGRRAAWLMLGLCTLGFFIYAYSSSLNKNKVLRLSAIISCVIGIILSVTIMTNQPTNDRFKTTLGLFSTDYASINKATALRLPIWKTALSIFKENPFNGIGPRGFRYIYNEYAESDDHFVKTNVPPTQPHLLILEVLAETGLIGIIGLMLLYYLIFTSRKKIKNLSYEFVFLIPVLVSIFPFNSHMAFYGSIWSSMVWLLIAFYFSYVKLASSGQNI
jgi:O-antigen ligase